MKIVVTGTPGTGKTSISRELSENTGWPVVELKNIEKPYDKEGDVNLKSLKKKTLKELRGKKNFIVEGHLACEFKIPCSVAVVLRCKPEVLEKRLKKRGYSKKKIEENVLAEALDYCLIKSLRNYKKVIQIDATEKLPVKKVLKNIKGFKTNEVDWFESLKRLAVETY